ncbi:MAG: hypothetical protein QG613_1574, partial [Pseudomonadota bacterium]|nr:hypothetical protein [Pseudomonadota bacterium]
DYLDKHQCKDVLIVSHSRQVVNHCLESM